MKLKNTPLPYLFGFVVEGYMRLVFATSRVRVVTPVPAELEHGAVILALWHQQLVGLPLAHRPNPRPLVGMMSRSGDGDFIAAIAARFGIGAVRGSSHRGAVPAVRDILRITRHGAQHPATPSLFITPDGPRGPAQVAKQGATGLARLTGLPLVPVAVWSTRAHTFGSWDHLRLPYPFTTFTVAYGAALPQATPEQLTTTLNALTAQARGTSNGVDNRVSPP